MGRRGGIAEACRSSTSPAAAKPVKTQQGYELDYAALEGLHRLANERGFGIVALHHTRKMEAETRWIWSAARLPSPAAPDTIAIIARNSSSTTLYVRGRDTEEAEHAAVRQSDVPLMIVGAAADVHRSEQRGAIHAASRKSSTSRWGRIAAATRQPVNNIRSRCTK